MMSFLCSDGYRLIACHCAACRGLLTHTTRFETPRKGVPAVDRTVGMEITFLPVDHHKLPPQCTSSVSKELLQHPLFIRVADTSGLAVYQGMQTVRSSEAICGAVCWFIDDGFRWRMEDGWF